MDDRKTNLRGYDRWKRFFLIAFFLLAALGCAVNPVFVILDFLLLVVFLAVEFAANRCPYCDKYLDRNHSRFCRYCGRCIREEWPET